MTIREAATALGARILHDEFEDVEITWIYTSDLLSDILAHAKHDDIRGGALVTIQAHINTVAVATVAGILAIIICNSRPVPEDMLTAAKEHGIALLLTRENQYVVSGKLYGLFKNAVDY